MLRSLGLAIGLAFLLAACGGGDSVGSVAGSGRGNPPTATAPTNLNYHIGNSQGAIAVRMRVGIPYVLDAPTVIGTVTGYSIDPALPAGLALDAMTGLISGTPTAALPETAYTVTTRNDVGSTTTVIFVTVFVPPTISYAGPVTARVGESLTPLVPAVSGDVLTYSVLPALPEGLMLDAATGVVSGTPTRQRVGVTYTITAANADTYGSADLVLAVNPPPAGATVAGAFRADTVIGLGYASGAHSGLTDASGAFDFESGQGISFHVGAVSIGTLPVSRPVVTPLDLVAQGSGTSRHVLNVVRFLMMLDQDGNPNNGIQISAAVTAAAAAWPQVDFDAADLPAALAMIIPQAEAADGVTHVLPDSAAAQLHLRTMFNCIHAGIYQGTFSPDSLPALHGNFEAVLFVDGSLHSTATRDGAVLGFEIQTSNALNAPLDGSFSQSAGSPSVSLQGSFPDRGVMRGSYQSPTSGSFLAVGGESSTYLFSGTYSNSLHTGTTPISIDIDAQDRVVFRPFHSLGGLEISSLTGVLSGNTFTGTATFVYPGNAITRLFQSSLTGTYTNTASGLTFDAQFFGKNGEKVAISTIGCRAH